MSNQQAVEWLIDEMNNIKGSSTNMNGSVQFIEKELNNLFEQAKAMEKKQREKDFVEGYKTRALASNLIFDEKSEYYAKTLFNRTYKTE